MKETFIMRTEFLEYMEELTDEDVGKLMRAVFTYEATDEVPEKGSLPPAVSMLFKVMKNNLDYCAEKYDEKRKNLSENGKKGGRPKKNAKDDEQPDGFVVKGFRDENTDCEENQMLSDENQKKQLLSDEKQKKQKVFSESKKSLYVVVNDNVTVNDTENDNVIVNAVAVANATATDGAAAAAEDTAGVKSLYEELIGKWTSNAEKTLFGFGLSSELICYAITEASNNNVPKLNYIKTILERLKKAGIDSVASARARPEKIGMDSLALSEMRKRIEKYRLEEEDVT